MQKLFIMKVWLMLCKVPPRPLCQVTPLNKAFVGICSSNYLTTMNLVLGPLILGGLQFYQNLIDLALARYSYLSKTILIYSLIAKEETFKLKTWRKIMLDFKIARSLLSFLWLLKLLLAMMLILVITKCHLHPPLPLKRF
jgi:hypothetical protein